MDQVRQPAVERPPNTHLQIGKPRHDGSLREGLFETLTVAERTIERDTRHSALQGRILAAFGVEAASWAPPASG